MLIFCERIFHTVFQLTLLLFYVIIKWIYLKRKVDHGKRKKEWTNTWHEDADTEKARVFLIGDSIVNGIQHFLYKLLPEGVTGSAYMTSGGR